jgi:mannose-6-phosphate isomerase-like protein (cupin superfamily)
VNEDRVAKTSGPVHFRFDYAFAEGGPVEAVRLPFASDAEAPFELARWTVEPGTANDIDLHDAREVWLVIAGGGRVTWAGREMRLRAGEAVAFDSRVQHRIANDGEDPLRVFSGVLDPPSGRAAEQYSSALRVGAHPFGTGTGFAQTAEHAETLKS